MKIIKDGVLKKIDLKQEDFKCEQCGCEFTADYDEYYVDKGTCFTTTSITYAYKASVTDIYVTCCPQCNKIVTKTKDRIVDNPTITLTSSTTADYIPDNCKNCLNHPSNGGSGNCNCMLGNMGQVTC